MKLSKKAIENGFEKTAVLPPMQTKLFHRFSPTGLTCQLVLAEAPFGFRRNPTNAKNITFYSWEEENKPTPKPHQSGFEMFEAPKTIQVKTQEAMPFVKKCNQPHTTNPINHTKQCFFLHFCPYCVFSGMSQRSWSD